MSPFTTVVFQVKSFPKNKPIITAVAWLNRLLPVYIGHSVARISGLTMKGFKPASFSYWTKSGALFLSLLYLYTSLWTIHRCGPCFSLAVVLVMEIYCNFSWIPCTASREWSETCKRRAGGVLSANLGHGHSKSHLPSEGRGHIGHFQSSKRLKSDKEQLWNQCIIGAIGEKWW